MLAEEVNDASAAVSGVSDVRDLRGWTLTSGMNVATAHQMTTTDAARTPSWTRHGR